MSDNGTNRMTITCPHCSQRFSVPIPHTTIFNDPRSSSAVAPHEKPIRCIGCHHYCAPAIQGLQITWVTLPLSNEQAAMIEPSRIITPNLTSLKLTD